jgi:hypothetical protein
VKKARSSEITRIFDSYTTNAHFVGTEQLVWVMGFDDRKKAGTANLQLVGHTKTYTKVVLPQTQDCIGDQPAEALVGKCVKVKITESQKWHISGYITDFAPKPEKVPANYFEELEQKRREALLKSFEEDENEKIVAKTDNALTFHLIGMAALAIGFYLLLRTVYHGLNLNY